MGNMNFRGEWLFCADYQSGEIVRAGGQSFLALTQSAGKDPQDPLNAAYWDNISGMPDIPSHNDLEGVQGGGNENKLHLTEDAAKAAEAANNPSQDNPMATIADLPVIPDHNGMNGIDGGTFHVSGNVYEAGRTANNPSATNPLATMAEIKRHNEQAGIQGGSVEDGEFYHLTQRAADAAEKANNPHRWNPFLTKSDLPQFTKAISSFHPVTMPAGSGMLYGSDYGAGIHLAVGDNCAMSAKASDPMSWTLDRNVPTGYWRGVAFGGLDIFVAAGLEGKAMWRGLNGDWNLLPVLGGNWNKVAYGNGMFVAVTDGAIMKSPDGKTGWILKNIDQGYGKDIAFDDGFFYIVGGEGMKKSADAETWTTLDLGTEATWRTAAAGGGGHLAALGGKCVRSHDGGATFAERRLPIGGWEESCYVSGFFVAVNGIDSFIFTEAARIHWEKREMPNYAIRGISSGEDALIAVGSRILVARVIDTGAALLNADGPNGSNPFVTKQELRDAEEELKQGLEDGLNGVENDLNTVKENLEDAIETAKAEAIETAADALAAAKSGLETAIAAAQAAAEETAASELAAAKSELETDITEAQAEAQAAAEAAAASELADAKSELQDAIAALAASTLPKSEFALAKEALGNAIAAAQSAAEAAAANALTAAMTTLMDAVNGISDLLQNANESIGTGLTALEARVTAIEENTGLDGGVIG